MVNKGKAKGKGKWKGKKKMGSNSNANPKPGPTKALKPKGGVQKDGDCHYCKKPGHWKRNCHAYLENLKKKKAAAASDSGIYVIEVNLSTSTSWELQGSRTLAKGEVDLRVGNGAKVAAIAVDVNSEPTPTTTNEPAQSSPQQKPARFKRRAHKPKRAKIPESEITDFTIQEEQTPSSPIPVDHSQALMVEPLQAVPITDATPLSPTTSPKASPTASAVDEEIRCDEPVTAEAEATQSDCQTPLSDHGQIPQSPMKIPKDAIVHDTAPENYKSDAVEESDKVAVEALQSLAQTGEEPIKSQSEDKGKSAQDNVEKVADPVPADEKANSDTEDDTSSDTDKDDNAEIPLTQQKWESTSQFNDDLD
ncbi:uncharacterized protein LOC135151419 [Daucus carota subsp. sativus]|uniref:uncharacterized protein LOC135151417 n=1 Tax=Daucus carota subsp. sativus TaxID=79200 RepID=UPI003082E9D6